TYYIAIGRCGTASGTFTLTATYSFNLIEPPDSHVANADEEAQSPLGEVLTGDVFADEERIAYGYRRRSRDELPILALPVWLPLWLEAAPLAAPPPAAIALRAPADTQTFEPIARFDSTQNKFVTVPIDLGADRGVATDQVFLVLFGTGLRGRSALSAVTARVGAVNVPVLYAGAAPDFIGLDQINLGPLPRSLAGRGEVDVVLTVDGKTGNMVRISIR
ncbi:MAG: hypothetical protein ACREEM_41630, partial [Blastocatellia bacterium]